MHASRTALAVATGLLALTGCSSDPGPAAEQPPAHGPAPASSPAPKADPARAELEKAVRAYSSSYFKPDGPAVYAALSQRCTAKIGDPEPFNGVVETAAKTYGKQGITTLTIDDIAGNKAHVSYTYAVPKLSQSSQAWAREGGAWKYDGC
ncbi:hypothetical protein [Streptomyces sp. PvR034]|uniref:hypothetical protein n=1 Tax=Streptomyces sp. PvR034 TaxID=3156401 RepID=UPI0033991EE3